MKRKLRMIAMLTGGTIVGLDKAGQLLISEGADIIFQKLVEEFNRLKFSNTYALFIWG